MFTGRTHQDGGSYSRGVDRELGLVGEPDPEKCKKAVHEVVGYAANEGLPSGDALELIEMLDLDEYIPQRYRRRREVKTRQGGRMVTVQVLNEDPLAVAE